MLPSLPQGNGIARCKQQYQDEDLFILDIYNGSAYPWDKEAKPVGGGGWCCPGAGVTALALCPKTCGAAGTTPVPLKQPVRLAESFKQRQLPARPSMWCASCSEGRAMPSTWRH